MELLHTLGGQQISQPDATCCLPPAARPPQDCFKLLGGMLRQCERWAPSQGQLRFLVTWAFADLEETAGRQNAFHLLKAILARKLVLPEVYDLMNRVQASGTLSGSCAPLVWAQCAEHGKLATVAPLRPISRPILPNALTHQFHTHALAPPACPTHRS